MKSFREYLTESVGSSGLEYELKIYNLMTDAIQQGISSLHLGSKPAAGFSNVGAGDIEATLHGKPFNIEIKSSPKDQMGGGSFRYDMHTKKFTPVKEMDPDDLSLLMDTAQDKIAAIDDYINAAHQIEPVEYHKSIDGIPLKISKKGRDELKAKGLLAKINSKSITNVGFINRHYNKKGVYYIQIGGAGLFYLGSNPLNLPVPALAGDIHIEMRLAYSGSKVNFPTTPPTDARTAGLRLQARLITKGKSPYTLDDIDSINQLFKDIA